MRSEGEKYRFGYQGEFAEQDDETGWNAFELRMYDSQIGRWMAPDPYRQYWSSYVGMGNNPMSLVDPDGGMTDPDPIYDGYLLPDLVVTAKFDSFNTSLFYNQNFGDALLNDQFYARIHKNLGKLQQGALFAAKVRQGQNTNGPKLVGTVLSVPLLIIGAGELIAVAPAIYEGGVTVYYQARGYYAGAKVIVTEGYALAGQAYHLGMSKIGIAGTRLLQGSAGLIIKALPKSSSAAKTLNRVRETGSVTGEEVVEIAKHFYDLFTTER